MSYDSAAWGALALAISLVLGVVTFYRFRSRGLSAGLRSAGWTLVPVAAWMTGVLELAFDLARDVGHWAVHLVFSPVVWLGIVLAGVAVVLFGAGTLLSAARRPRGGPAVSSATARGAGPHLRRLAAATRRPRRHRGHPAQARDLLSR